MRRPQRPAGAVWSSVLVVGRVGVAEWPVEHGPVERVAAAEVVAVHRLVRRSCVAAGVPERLAHPHALRAYWATHLLEAGIPVHEVSARLVVAPVSPVLMVMDHALRTTLPV